MSGNDFDDILTDLSTSKWNYFHLFVFSLVTLTMPSFLLCGPFITPSITHKCKPNTSEQITIIDECHYLDSKNNTKKCTSWEYESKYFPSTMTEEFDLVCDKAYLRPTFQSSYMIGNFFGAPISGFLADRYGRYKMILIGTIVVVSSGAFYTFLSNVFLIILLRFIMGILHSSMRTAAYILCLEISEQKHRFATAILIGIPWTVGVCMYGILGYVLADWRWLQRIQIIPAIFALILIRYHSESPRWLIVNGKFEEALKELRHAAKLNGSTLPPEEEIIRRMKAIQKSSLSEQRKEETNSSKKEIVMNALCRVAVIFRTPVIRKLTLLMYTMFFAASLVYYGLTLNGTNFNLNPFMYMIVGGIIELPGSSVILPIVHKYGIVLPAGISYLGCGIVVIALIFVSNELNWLITIFALTGRCLISVSFTMVYLIASEAYPTEVRMQGIGTSQLVGRLGAILAPYITDFANAAAHPSLPPLIFGMTSIIAGAFTFLVPETQNSHLSETITMMELKYSENKKSRWHSVGTTSNEKMPLVLTDSSTDATNSDGSQSDQD